MFRSGTEEEAIEDARILERQRCEGMRKSEDDVGVGNGKQGRFLLLEPRGGCSSLTLGAMPAAAGVVGDDAVPARVTLVDVSAERGRPTGSEMRHPAPLMLAQRADARLDVWQPEDLRDFVPRRRSHRSWTASVCRSSGLRTLCRRSVETCV
jgi:hypothetical protein